MTLQAVAETGLSLSPKSMTALGLIRSVFTDGQSGWGALKATDDTGRPRPGPGGARWFLGAAVVAPAT